MPITAADWSADSATKIIDYIGDDHTRFGGSTPSYATVIEFHRWAQDLADDPTWSGDDEIDITIVSPTDRSTDNIITMVNGWLITARAAEHLYDGSITQGGGAEIFDGIVNFGNTTDIQIIQNGEIVGDDWWNTGSGGLNADLTSGISHRFMILTRTAGADIDSKKLIGVTRNFLNTYGEFTINAAARGNNVLALSELNDLNNATAASTVAGWTDVVNDNEGYSLIDANGDTTNETYYSDWEYGSRAVNDFYERQKWIVQAPQIEDSNTDTGNLYVVDNATITGAAQSWQNGSNAMYVTKVTAYMQATGSPTGNMTCSIFTHSGSYGTSSIPLVISGVASDGLDTSVIGTAAVEQVTFNFSTPVAVAASTDYTVVFEHPDGDGSNYIEVQGLTSSGTHSGNRSHNTAGWTAVAADDLRFEVYTSPQMYGLPGALFRGITHQVDLNTAGSNSGTFTEPELVTWTGGTGQMLAIEDTTASGADNLWIQLLTGAVPGDGVLITGDSSAATATTAAASAVTERTVSTPHVGISTGSAIIGAYGFGIGADDLTASDSVTDLTDTVRNPPNNVTFTVTGVVSGEDRVIVSQLGYRFAFDNEGGTPPFTVGETLNFTTPTGSAVLHALQDDGTTGIMVISEVTSGDQPVNNSGITGASSGATADVNGAVVPDIAVRQFTLQTALTTDNITAVQINVSIPDDTPSTGTIRVQDDKGLYRRLEYDTEDAADTWSITTTDGNEDFAGDEAAAGNNVFISYIDKLATGTSESFTGVYQTDRNVFVRVRDGGTAGDNEAIKPFETTGTLGSAGGSATASRISDE